MPILWLLVAAIGGFILFLHQTTAGLSGLSPEQWPQGAIFAAPSARPVLVMFAHPHCPCTRASLEQLNRLLVQCSSGVDVNVVFVGAVESAKTHQTELWGSATRIPTVEVHHDSNGDQARLFHALTSGHVVLYGSQGRLLFSGGITAGRGHAGDNTGAKAVAAILSGSTGATSTPVYGCALFSGCERGVACTK